MPTLSKCTYIWISHLLMPQCVGDAFVWVHHTVHQMFRWDSYANSRPTSVNYNRKWMDYVPNVYGPKKNRWKSRRGISMSWILYCLVECGLEFANATYKVCMLFNESNVPFDSDWMLLSYNDNKLRLVRSLNESLRIHEISLAFNSNNCNDDSPRKTFVGRFLILLPYNTLRYNESGRFEQTNKIG